MFTIYSIGDSAYLQQILNAVAMICGTGDFVQLVSIGLILGIIAVCVQSIISASKDFNLHHILLGWVMYACFFGPGVTVTIEDAYTGQVRVVDNVPIGVGFAGGLISNVGYGVTRLFQQGYQGADATNNQIFTESLRQLQAVRRNAGDAQVIDAINRAIDPTGSKGVDFEKSVSNYLKECTFVKIALGEMTKEELYRGNYQTAMPFQSKVYGTRLYLGNGVQDESPNCSVAWGLIQDALKKTEDASVIRVINRVAGIKGIGPGAFPANTGAIDNSLRLMNLTGTTGQDFIRTSIIEPIYQRAAHGYYTDMGDIAAATMVSQAVAQRNTQWAAEQTMFMTTVRPLLTFFEGFILAITPVVGFLFVIGLFGIRLGVRYFQTLLWIQLWMPVISICNLYITMAARGDMASYSNTMDSFYLLGRLDTSMQTWIATGGMLCAMTPIVSLFLVTGSTYAFTTLASRLGGADHLNEKTVAPDALKVDAVHSQQPFGQGNSVQSINTGWDSAFQTLNMSKMADANVSSSKQSMVGKQDALVQSLVNGDSQVRQIAEKAGYNKVVSDNLQNSQNEDVRSFYQNAYELGKSLSMNAEKAHQFATDLTTSVGMNLGGNGSTSGASTTSSTRAGIAETIGNQVRKVLSSTLGGGLGANATYKTLDTEAVKEATNNMTKDVAGVGKQSGFQASVNQAWSDGLQTSAGTELAKTLAKTESSSLQDTAQSFVSAQETYQDAVSLRENMGAVANMTSKDFVSTVSQGPNGSNAMRAIQELYMSMPAEDRQQVQNRANALEASNFAASGYSSQESIKAAAVMEVAQRNPVEYGDDVSHVWQVGTGLNYRGDYDVNKPEEMPQAQGASGFVNGNIERIGDDFDQRKAEIESMAERGENALQRTQEAADRRVGGFNDSADKVDADATNMRSTGLANTFDDGVRQMKEQKVPEMNQKWSPRPSKLIEEMGKRNGWDDRITNYMAHKYGVAPDVPGSLPGGPVARNWPKEGQKEFHDAIHELYAPEVKAGLITKAQVNEAIKAMDGLLENVSRVEENRMEAYLAPMTGMLNKTPLSPQKPMEAFEARKDDAESAGKVSDEQGQESNNRDRNMIPGRLR